MIRYSPDEAIQKTQPKVKSGRKWTASAAIQDAESSLKIKEVIGAVQTGRAGLGQTPHRWYSQQDPKGAREMVTDEIRSFEEGKRQTIAAGFAKQCTWTQWENAEQRKLTWSSLQKMEPLRISFLLRSTYDLLPTPTNLKQWGMTQDDICLDCGKSRATLEHILATCSSSLQKYTWRHNQVLKVLSEATKTQCENISLINTTIDEDVRFVREGTQPSAKKPKGVRAKLLEDDSDWQALIDLEE